MTYSRVLDRNGIRDGDYDTIPARWSYGRFNDEETTLWRGQIKLLAGDLRRLEQDVVDEKAICAYLVHKTGVDADTVALVLRAFLEW